MTLREFEDYLVVKLILVCADYVKKKTKTSLGFKKILINWPEVLFDFQLLLTAEELQRFKSINQNRLRQLYYRKRKLNLVKNLVEEENLGPIEITRSTKVQNHDYYKIGRTQVLLIEFNAFISSIQKLRQFNDVFVTFLALNQMLFDILYKQTADGNSTIAKYNNQSFVFEWGIFLHFCQSQLQLSELSDKDLSTIQKSFFMLFCSSQMKTKEGVVIFPGFLSIGTSVQSYFNTFVNGKYLPIMSLQYENFLTNDIYNGNSILDKATLITITFLVDKIEGWTIQLPVTLPMDIKKVTELMRDIKCENNEIWDLNTRKLIIGLRTLMLEIAKGKRKQRVDGPFGELEVTSFTLSRILYLLDYSYLLSNKKISKIISLLEFIDKFFIEYNLGYWIIKTDSGNISVKDLSGVRNMNKWKSDLFIQLIPNKEVWSLPNYYNSPSIELKKSMFPKSNNSINKSYSDNLDGSKKNILEKIYVMSEEDKIFLVPRKIKMFWDKLLPIIKNLEEQLKNLKLETALNNEPNLEFFNQFVKFKIDMRDFYNEYFSLLNELNSTSNDKNYFYNLFTSLKETKKEKYSSTDWFNKKHVYEGLFPKSFNFSFVKNVFNLKEKRESFRYNRLYENSRKSKSSFNNSESYDSATSFYGSFKEIFFAIIANLAFNSFLINIDLSAAHAKISMGINEKMGNLNEFNPNWDLFYNLVSKEFYSKNSFDYNGNSISSDFLLKNGLNRKFIKSYVLALINGRNPATPLLELFETHDSLKVLRNNESLYTFKKDDKEVKIHKYYYLLSSLKDIILSFEFVQQFINWSKEITEKKVYLFGKDVMEQLIDSEQMSEINNNWSQNKKYFNKISKSKASLIMLTYEALLLDSLSLGFLKEKYLIVNLEFDGLKIITGDSSNINNLNDLSDRLASLEILDHKFLLYIETANRLMNSASDISLEVYLSNNMFAKNSEL